MGRWAQNPAVFVKNRKYMANLARTEFSSALNAIANERGLDPSVVLETIKQAIVAAYRRDVRERGEDVEEKVIDATIDPQTGEARIFIWDEGKEDDKEDVTPPGFGRIAAQTAKQVILQKIREAEKDAVLLQYAGKVGSLVSGTVLRFDGPNVRVDVGKTEGIMPPGERIPNERLNVNQRLTFLLKEIRETGRGRDVILSRADPEIVKKLFAREVPEIGSGAVEIKIISREPGSRTKVAVFSTQSGVDPVGSCVGQKGVRVQAVINELSGEKVDVIPWTEDPVVLIVSALSPAAGASVTLDEKKKEAKVMVPEDQLSLAIGKEGQNVRLASRLTGWKIEIGGIEVEEKEEVVKQKAKVRAKKEPLEIKPPEGLEEKESEAGKEETERIKDTNEEKEGDSQETLMASEAETEKKPKENDK